MKTGSIATVKGDYLYYHYMQGGMDDNVNSLRNFTVLFIMYTPPTGLGLCLPVIADSLVMVLASRLQWAATSCTQRDTEKCGGRQAKRVVFNWLQGMDRIYRGWLFSQSTPWGECVPVCGVTCVVVCCSQLEYKIKDTVKDMSSVGRILLEHFKTHGTPVMIGTYKSKCHLFCSHSL